MPMKKVCVVTSTRAEYGLLKELIRNIHADQDLELCLVVTGTHLSQDFGYTVSQIEQDGFPIAERIDILVSGDTPAAISKTQGMAFISFADMYARQKPDMVVVLGDRTEMIPIAFAAANERIPIAHISGGETTEGAIDECVRHSLTKVSFLHFPGCEAYRKRIIQLGEHPDRVFNFGDVGVEMVRIAPKLDKGQLSCELAWDFTKQYICVVFHPVTLEIEQAGEQTDQLLLAINEHDEFNYVFIQGNSDAGGQIVSQKIRAFVEQHNNCKLFTSLRSEVYTSVVANASALMGNSSSGIVEAPALRVPTINIGDRQKGRLQANSILNCEPKKGEISEAITALSSVAFQKRMRDIQNMICSIINFDSSWINLLTKGIICVVIPNGIYVLINYKQPEFKKSLGKINMILHRRA